MKQTMRVILSVLLLLSLCICMCSCKTAENAQEAIPDRSFLQAMPSGGVMVASDPHFLYYFHEIGSETTDDMQTMAEIYISDYVGYGITDLTFCIFGQSSVTPSEVWTTWADKCTWTEENGVPVDYASDPIMSVYQKYYGSEGVDPLDLLIQETRKQGIHPWLTFRMNDAHGHGETTGVSRGNEYYQFFNSEQMVHGNTNSYYDTCFNFENETVRQHYLAYLEEQILRYDCDGVDLDFTREWFCFEYWENEPEYYCEIMTQFIAQVYQITTRAAEKHGHQVKLLVRVPRDIEQSRVFGFDAKQWIEQGIVDVIVPSPRYTSTDSAIPIGDWVALTEGTDVEIYAGQERYLANEMFGQIDQTAETGKGFAAAAYSQGASKIYLSNFGTYHLVRHYDIWEAVSSPEKAYTGTRRHIVTYQEKDVVPKGFTQYKPLPERIHSGYEITVSTGKIQKTDKVTIYFDALLSGCAAPTVTVNGVTATPSSDVSGAFWQKTQGTLLAYTLEGYAGENDQTIQFSFDGADSIVIYNLEICVETK